MLPANFWINQAISILLLVCTHYICGLLVKNYGIKVNYTRKINHFLLFFLPPAVSYIIKYPITIQAIVIRSCFAVMCLCVYIKPIRQRFAIVRTMFMSFDRPEDRPHTMLWLSTQIVVTLVIFIAMSIFFMSRGLFELTIIPVLISGIGDGLAEPIGIRFGKHTYQVRALFSKRKYTRSIEGSLCVFITSILTVLAYYSMFSNVQFWITLSTIPILLTLTEAFSPHTWDQPFLYLVGGTVLGCIILLTC